MVYRLEGKIERNLRRQYKMEPIFAFIAPATAGIILVVALIIFGPGKLPEIGKGLGKGMREFKSATDLEVQNEKDNTTTKTATGNSSDNNKTNETKETD